MGGGMPTGMSRTGPTSRMRLEDVLVVDVDVHPLDEARDLVPYCDEPWRQVLAEDQQVAPYPSNSRLYAAFPAHYTLQKNKSPTPADMRADLDDLGIDIGVLFAQGFHTIGNQPNAEYAMAVTRAHNRWLTDVYLERERGLYGAIGVAPQDPEASAREIEAYARQRGMVGVMMPCQNLAPPWGHRRFDPIFETAQRFGLPMLYHGGPPPQLAVHFDMAQLDTSLMYHTYTHNVLMIVTVASLLATGVPVRFPRLDHVFIEAGIGWAAHMMLTLDRSWEDRRGDVPWLEERPSAYMRRHFYYGTQPIEEPANMSDVADLIRIAGEDNVMYASDWPHHDFDHPKRVFDIPVTAEAKQKIMGDNALRVLRISDVEALTAGVPGKTIRRQGNG
jgi:uncharacterized protein